MKNSYLIVIMVLGSLRRKIWQGRGLLWGGLEVLSDLHCLRFLVRDILPFS